MIENPGSGGVVIRQEYNSTVVEIPAKRHWTVILFMMVWLAGWAFGEFSALTELLSFEGPMFANAFIIFWLIGWTFGGGFAFYTILWQLIGKEIIRMEMGKLIIKKSIAGIGRKKEYEADSIKNMQVILDAESSIPGKYNKKAAGRQARKIMFDYGNKIIRFGIGIDEAEAQMVFDRLRQSGWLRSENFTSENDRTY